jgi:hypothetical protein
VVHGEATPGNGKKTKGKTKGKEERERRNEWAQSIDPFPRDKHHQLVNTVQESPTMIRPGTT